MFVVDPVLGDGSFLSWVYPRRGKRKKAHAIRVRVIAYTYTDEKGEAHTSRLLTSLLDAARHAAAVLVDLYHLRWEQEGVFEEIESTLSGRVTQVMLPVSAYQFDRRHLEFRAVVQQGNKV